MWDSSTFRKKPNHSCNLSHVMKHPNPISSKNCPLRNLIFHMSCKRLESYWVHRENDYRYSAVIVMIFSKHSVLLLNYYLRNDILKAWIPFGP